MKIQHIRILKKRERNCRSLLVGGGSCLPYYSARGLLLVAEGLEDVDTRRE